MKIPKPLPTWGFSSFISLWRDFHQRTDPALFGADNLSDQDKEADERAVITLCVKTLFCGCLPLFTTSGSIIQHKAE